MQPEQERASRKACVALVDGVADVVDESLLVFCAKEMVDTPSVKAKATMA